ncbi:MAG TPA: lipid-binding SYLF domain-containing protein [Stellaceae bacterium]|nr:lipid-binding SYLF domain-containing protein [Stellaceae bacterium]
MSMKLQLCGPASALALALAISASPAQAASSQQNLVDKAVTTINDLRHDNEFGNAKDLMHRARAVMVVPGLVKAGFFLGGEGGDAVLMTRTVGGGWSDPAFYTLASASFGLQAGVEEAEVVMFVMSDRALQAFMNDEFKIGAQGGLAIATLGSEAEAATSSNLNADIIVWSSASGAYAGVTLNGSIIKPQDSNNAAYYGHPVRPADIVVRDSVHNPNDGSLRQALAEAP